MPAAVGSASFDLVVGSALWRFAVALAGAFIAGTGGLAAPGPAAAATATFAYTGAAQSLMVPAGVTQATFDLYGAQGTTPCAGTAEGAHVQATIAVVPGALANPYTALPPLE